MCTLSLKYADMNSREWFMLEEEIKGKNTPGTLQTL